MTILKSKSRLPRTRIQRAIKEMELDGVAMVPERLMMMPNGDIVCTNSMERLLRSNYPTIYNSLTDEAHNEEVRY